MRRYAGESLADRQARRKQQFMHAGLELFGTQGYRKTTVRMLCQTADLTDRYFYESFAHTEDLLVAVYQAQMAAVAQDMNLAVAAHLGEGTQAVVQAALRAVFAQVAKPCVGRIILLEILGVSATVDALYMRTFNGFADAVVTLARHLHPTMALSDEEARVVGLAIIGAVTQSATYWMLGHYKESQETLVKCNALIIEGLLNTLA
jgi:AcrR family transcriptional regulator